MICNSELMASIHYCSKSDFGFSFDVLDTFVVLFLWNVENYFHKGTINVSNHPVKSLNPFVSI